MELRDLRPTELDVLDDVVLEGRLDCGGNVRCSQDDPAVRDQPGVFQELAHVLSRNAVAFEFDDHLAPGLVLKEEVHLQSSPFQRLLTAEQPMAPVLRSQAPQGCPALRIPFTWLHLLVVLRPANAAAKPCPEWASVLSSWFSRRVAAGR